MESTETCKKINLIPTHLDYREKERNLKKSYTKAFESPKFKQWVASLSPEIREEAEKKGLFKPYEDTESGFRSIENLPPQLEPHTGEEICSGENYTEESIFNMDDLTEEQQLRLTYFLNQGKSPRLRYACFYYLQGHGTCEGWAKKLNMSKQDFHYLVRNIEKQLALRPTSNRRGEKTRNVYRMSNKRKRKHSIPRKNNKKQMINENSASTITLTSLKDECTVTPHAVENFSCLVNKSSKTDPQAISSCIEGIIISNIGLITQKDNLTAEEFSFLFRYALALHQKMNWVLGDILLLGDRKWGNRYTGSKYQEAMRATGLSQGTIRDIVHTCKIFPIDKRNPQLSFSHHREISFIKTSPKQRDSLLRKAAEEKLSTTALRQYIRQNQFDETSSVDYSRPPQGEEPDRWNLPNLPEKDSSDAKPMWAMRILNQLITKEHPEKYSAEQCTRVITMAEKIDFYFQRVKRRQEQIKAKRNAM